MPTQLQFRRGTTSQNNSFTGAVGEITVDTETDALILHDGSGAGGIEVFPSGTIVGFGNATPPSGFLACNDQAVSRTTYARLFAAIGTTFGVGDGASTFNVPDLRDRAPLGTGTNTSMGAATSGIGASAVMTSATKSGVQTGSSTTGSTTVSLSKSNGTFATSAKDSSTSSAMTNVTTSAHTHSIPALTVADFTISTTLPSQGIQFMIKT